MKKILVAGGTGFIGYNVAKKAIEKKFKVYSISKNPAKKNRYIKKVKYIYLDLSKKNLKVPSINSYDYIVNCSGYGKHFKFNSEGKKLYKQHFNSLKNLTRHLSKKKLKKFIQLGSCLEYSSSKSKINENFRCIPNSIYGQAKLACTKYLKSLYKTSSLPVTIFRIFQVYGPKQDQNRLIPFIIEKCKKNKTFNLTTGEQKRDFCYIDDLVSVIFKSFKEKKSNGEIINIGYGKSHKIKQVVNIVRKIVGSGKPIFGVKKMHIGEKKIIIPNISKVKKILKWQPKYSLINGIRKIIYS
tara:strand:- start:361 stop:1254 length:894 start_codon:yes stop_codon:yes gene_type:complete